MVVVAMGEGVDQRLELIEMMGEIVTGVEFVAPSAVAALDRAWGRLGGST